MKKIQIFGRQIVLPRTRFMRTILGVMLILGGILGFLPILGFWMIPLGILILSQDFAVVRRFKRKTWVKFNHWWVNRKKERK